MRPIALFFLLSLLTTPILAANLTLERRISEQLEKSTLVGKPIWLQAGPLRFLGILEKNTAGKHYGAVILLHGAGANADWQEVIAPLRHYLAGSGWDSLSLQMPVTDLQLPPADNTALSDEAIPRIRAAVAYFTERKVDHLILIGHGQGARSALAYLSGQPDRAVHALVAIGLAAQSDNAQDPVLSAIGKLNLPMLDLYGSRDQPAVLDSAEARLGIARRNQRDAYRQDRVMGADHNFSGMEQSLQLRVGAWLRRVTEQR
jgi:pimeloyl-ACP methyl ester carboxylesterase